MRCIARAVIRHRLVMLVTVRYSEVRYSEKFSSDKCDSGSGLGLGLRLGLDSDFITGIAFFGIANFGIVNWNQ